MTAIPASKLLHSAGADAKPVPQRDSLIRLLLSTTLRRHATPMLLFMVASNVLMLAVPLFMSQVYDRVLSSRSYETLGYLVILTVAALVTYSIMESVRGVLAHRVVMQFMATTAQDVVSFLVRSNLPEAKRNQIVRDLNVTGTFMAGRAATGLLDLPFVPVFVVLLAVVHLQLAILSLVSISAVMLTTWLNNRFSKELEKKATEQTNEAMQFMASAFNRDEDVRSMGMQKSMVSRWSVYMGKALTASDASVAISSKMYGFSKLVRQLVQISQLGLGAVLVLKGEMSGGLIFVASTLASRALQPIEQLIGASSGIMQTQAAWARIEDVLEQADSETDIIELPAAQGKLDVDGVSYHSESLSGARTILDHVTVSLVPGKLTALVGPSGAGKSTLARIVAGALAPSEGKVRLDGFDYEQWKPEARGNAIGYVGQDVNLFAGSVAENIARMSETLDEARVLDAAQKAGVHALIATLPDGYGTRIGPGGLRLSGGQRQRIALARAFYGMPRLLVLDEPNSNLDTAGEQQLAESLLQAKTSGITILLVSQRESILSIADRVLVMEGGRIVRDLVPAQPKPASQNAAPAGNTVAVARPSVIEGRLVPPVPPVSTLQ